MHVKPGDWIAFYQAGVIKYAKVEYVQARVGLCDEACTTEGTVGVDSILELRKSENEHDSIHSR